ncbi:U4/U6.U5 tri-snRNP-associated protein 1 [Geosmithia morbida]|uniref:U4/U6.U5 tri-snRNP-associated protein 1 n=1 Tax=Geosmithia morbida TaxID=1094350 RepID=A0A9P5D4R3_9HYPO|nr:U4/U6.U5 tri-snRNP-associated protein 1 [Geosmithia morbida]KAF4123811.1 U4/U6.U5 tri-snRNP-associated protein 1 [Geosmithia morbida]
MDAATIEETNRIRVSLGMQPLPVPGAAPPPSSAGSDNEREEAEAPSTVETRQAQAYDNYNKAMEAEAARKKREERVAAIKKAREKAQRAAKLEGHGLGDLDKAEADADAKSWLMGQKKRQKKIEKVRKLEEELAAAEAEAAANVQYTSKDLAGIKVAHDTSAFLDGDEQILTLKDSGIGGADDEEDDELENIELRSQEKLQDKLDLKKKRPGYNPNDDDMEGGILAQYDEEINGKKTKQFTLDDKGTFNDLADILGQPVDKAERGENVSLDDIVGDGPVSGDYLAPSEIKIKKSKKKSKKGTRQKRADDDDIIVPTEPSQQSVSDAMDMDGGAPAKKKRTVEDDLVDDEDLQASLAVQRRNALKKRKRTRPEDLVRRLKEQDSATLREEEQQEDGGLVIGAASEFVSGLKVPDDDEEEEALARKRRKATTKTPDPRETPADGDQVMDDADSDRDQGNPEPSDEQAAERDAPVDEEKTVGQGMGAALSLLRERGLVEPSRGEEEYTNLRNREDFMAKKRLLEEELEEQTRQQRERDRRSGKLDKMSAREREEYARQQNAWRDQQQSRRMAELYSAGYKPSVRLAYTDDHGRQLNQKEAFKHLSHQFHGKGSGKGKTEKLLKQIDDEKRRQAQSMFDATQNGGMSTATAQQLKKRREAGVRLG